MTATHDIVIKSDRRGRLRFTPEQRAAMLEAFDASGLSGPKFAQLHGINYQTFAGWVQRRRRQSAAPPPAAGGLFTLLEATVEGRPERALEVLLPGGARLLIGERSHLDLAAALIRQLQSPQPC
jgi:transposase-like protein